MYRLQNLEAMTVKGYFELVLKFGEPTVDIEIASGGVTFQF